MSLVAVDGTAVRLLAADSFTLARLWVLRSNERARRFYERQGWVAEDVAKTRTFQAGLVVDEVRYARDLTGTTTA